MKKVLLVLSCVTALWLNACSGTDNKVTSATDSTVSETSTVTNTTDDNAQKVQIRQIQNDSIILATVQSDLMPDSINLSIEHPFQQIHILIKQVHTDSLIARLAPMGTDRNIRINQIVTADHQMDGPFGREIRYQTKQKGDYTLILGKDNMADGKVEGEIRVYLHLK